MVKQYLCTLASIYMHICHQKNIHRKDICTKTQKRVVFFFIICGTLWSMMNAFCKGYNLEISSAFDRVNFIVFANIDFIVDSNFVSEVVILTANKEKNRIQWSQNYLQKPMNKLKVQWR